MVSHQWPSGVDVTRKESLPGAPLVGVSNSRLVNLYIARLTWMVCEEDTRIILVEAECPYIQFQAARVTSTEFVVGEYKLATEG